MHVDELLRGRTPGSEHGVEQVGEPIGFADDDARVFAQRRIEQLALEQLRGAAQAAQRVLDLVRELANHETAAAELREQRVLAREPPMLRDVLDLEQQTVGLCHPSAASVTAQSRIRSTPPGAGQRELALHHASPPCRARSNSGRSVSAPRLERR